MTLEQAIRDISRDRWVILDATPNCVDYDSAARARFMLFAFHGASPDNAIREHLIDCERCRFLYCAISAMKRHEEKRKR